MTNTEFAEKDREFRAACERAGIPPSKRQASKWRLGFGKAWDNRNGISIDKEEKLSIAS
jgi:hypothetical protein